MKIFNADKDLGAPCPAAGRTGQPEISGAGPGGATAGARRWRPRQGVFALRPAHPLGGLAIESPGPFWQVGLGGWRARSVTLSCPGTLPWPLALSLF
jgi:hypothetical protein